MADSARKEYPTKRAVIDIGSNSVRLVIYDGKRRAPVVICNEKALCGLGRDMSEDNALNPDAVDYAMSTLKRYKLLLEKHDNPPTLVIATAAVREAADGKAFVKKIKNLGFSVEVIEGVREAKLAALGVIFHGPEAHGVVGDMGGGSLELVAVKEGRTKNEVSLSIGPLRLMQRCGGDITKAQRLIDKALNKVDWIKPGKSKTLYAVGGAWRAVARIHMRLRGYPLSILHGYEMTRREAIDACDLIASQSRQSLEEIPGISRRRIDTLPYAALVLKALLLKLQSERMRVSAGGVREGLLYEELDETERSFDPLLSGASFFAERFSSDVDYGSALAAMTAGLFPDEDDRGRRITEATCLLSDTASFFHPELRGEHAFDTALRGPFYAISHQERVAMAVSLFVRHEGRRATFPDTDVIELLSDEQKKKAIQLGLAMRFAGALAPKTSLLLSGCSLNLEDEALVFSAPRSLESLMEDFPRRRLDALASAFGTKAVEVYSD